MGPWRKNGATPLMKGEGDAEWENDQDDLAWAVDHRPWLNCCRPLRD